MNKELSTGLQEVLAHVEGKKTGGRVTRYQPPDVDVVAIRTKLGFSQEEFARHYGFSVSTIRNWEQGRRSPEGPARTLLLVIDKNPNVVDAVIRDQAASNN